MHNKEALEEKWAAWSNRLKKAITTPTPQSSLLKIQQRDKPQNFWNKVICSDETKIKLFGCNHKHYIWREVNKAYDEKHTIPAVEHGGGSLMFWGCVSFSGTGNMVKIDGKMNAPCYQKILEENLHSSVRKLCMGRTRMFQHDNDPKRKVKSTCYWLKSVATSVSWPQYHWDTLGRSQICSSCKTAPQEFTGTGGFLLRRMGSFTIWENKVPHPQLSQKTSSHHWC